MTSMLRRHSPRQSSLVLIAWLLLVVHGATTGRVEGARRDPPVAAVADAAVEPIPWRELGALSSTPEARASGPFLRRIARVFQTPETLAVLLAGFAAVAHWGPEFTFSDQVKAGTSLAVADAALVVHKGWGDLREAMRAGDRRRAARALGEIKSAPYNLGFTGLTTLAGGLLGHGAAVHTLASKVQAALVASDIPIFLASLMRQSPRDVRRAVRRLVLAIPLAMAPVFHSPPEKTMPLQVAVPAREYPYRRSPHHLPRLFVQAR